MVPGNEIIYPDLSYSVIGCAMDVHNELGSGWEEWDYHRAMIRALESKGHIVVSHERSDLLCREMAIDHFELDLLVDDLVILELKRIRQDFHPEHYVQIINYLKHWGKRLGILINFGLERLTYKRVPFDSIVGSVEFTGKWIELEKAFPEHYAGVLASVQTILENSGYGYGVNVFKNLLMAEFMSRELSAIKPFHAPAYRGMQLESRELDCILLGGHVLISLTAAGRGSSSADLACLKSYMKQLAIPCGLLVDVGSPEIHLKGVL